RPSRTRPPLVGAAATAFAPRPSSRPLPAAPARKLRRSIGKTGWTRDMLASRGLWGGWSSGADANRLLLQLELFAHLVGPDHPDVHGLEDRARALDQLAVAGEATLRKIDVVL